jgi:hypothetical protein
MFTALLAALLDEDWTTRHPGSRICLSRGTAAFSPGQPVS